MLPIKLYFGQLIENQFDDSGNKNKASLMAGILD